MFTGIITGMGHIVNVQTLGKDASYGKQLRIQAPTGYLDDVANGDSIALNGACMTVTQLDLANHTFCVDISAESLNKTTGLDKEGAVNLEKALRADERLGGHIVSGHVDGIGTVTAFTQQGESYLLQIRAPRALAAFFAYKGSVAVQGVSLTINKVQDDAEGCTVSINLIPHTVAHTTLQHLNAGSLVNLEIDMLARYVQRMLAVQNQE